MKANDDDTIRVNSIVSLVYPSFITVIVIGYDPAVVGVPEIVIPETPSQSTPETWTAHPETSAVTVYENISPTIRERSDGMGDVMLITASSQTA